MSNATKIPVLPSVRAMREWRQQQMERPIGLVITMGALHDGHIDLVRRSLADNVTTVLSLFVNPAQFAPNEDYGTYPKTFDHDMKQLADALAESSVQANAVVFLPSVKDMYPSGIELNVSDQKGAFVEVKGFSHQMEGNTRPTFFRGVATVVAKLFNVVQPTRAYFGQKDIQQALILRRMTGDLLFSHPLPSNVIIVPTHRSATDGLALSSRNIFLSVTEREYAGTLYAALRLAQREWEGGSSSAEQASDRAKEFVRQRAEEAEIQGVKLRLDYIALNDPETFEPVGWAQRDDPNRTAILSGALFVGKTRLIDNLLCGDTSTIISSQPSPRS